MVESLPTKHESLSSNPRITHKKIIQQAKGVHDTVAKP
jgi:hypothetical protein